MNEFGESIPEVIEDHLPAEAPNTALIQQYRQQAAQIVAQATSRRGVLEAEVDSLGECVAMAAQIYQDHPIPDNAYQLAALTNAHNSALSQLEKMKDPKVILEECENHIKGMFTQVLKSLIVEIDKTKKELHRIYPTDKATVEDQFNRMLTAISPEAQKLYDTLHESLKKTLGIRK